MVVIGAFMSILDTTIVNVGLARLSRELHSLLHTIQWVATGYLVARAVVIPLTGWASERFGAKRLWIVVVALFVAGSALPELAWSAGSLILFRVLQGLGGGMMMPSAPRPNSTRPVLARGPDVASTKAAAAPPAVALPVSDNLGSTAPLVWARVAGAASATSAAGSPTAEASAASASRSPLARTRNVA
jgi:MFS family permease